MRKWLPAEADLRTALRYAVGGTAGAARRCLAFVV